MSISRLAELRRVCKEGRLEEAMRLLQESVGRPGYYTYICLLQACIRMKALADGRRVHAHMAECGFQPNTTIGNILIHMYAECGSMVDAHHVFDGLPSKSIVSWNALIAGYAGREHPHDAFTLFRSMQHEGLKPDKFTFVSILKACATHMSLEQGKHFHAQIPPTICHSDVYVQNSLVYMYAKCGSLADARHVFDEMGTRNTVSWNTMLSGYIRHGRFREAIEMFLEMRIEGLTPDRVTLISIAKACGGLGDLEQALWIYADIIKSQFALDVCVESTLIDMFSRCGDVVKAREIFDLMRKRDVVSWNVMISGYVQSGDAKEALKIFQRMQWEGVNPDKFTLVSILNACAALEALEQGKQIHAQVMSSGCQSDAIVANALIDMYAKCGSLVDACHVFDKMIHRDVVSWNSMIAGYSRHGCGEKALRMFWKMQHEGEKPDKVTFIVTLNTCSSLMALKQGEWIHSQILRSGCELDVFIGSTLVDMYAKCGDLVKARCVFDSMPSRNVVSWNVMIMGYVQHGNGEEALQCFWQMQRVGVKPDKVTFLGTLNACSILPSLKQGKEIHACIIRIGCELDIFLGTALADMYSKCGSVSSARQVFDLMPERNLASWNAMIAGYAQHGHGKEALEMFEQMQQEGIKPDSVTAASVLSACSNAGLVDEGCRYFLTLNEEDAIMSTTICMVDLLGRMGHLEDAFNFIQEMPISPYSVVWLALLGASKIYGAVKLAHCAVDCILKLEPEHAVALVLLSNVYAEAGRWDDKARVRKMIQDSCF